MDIKQMNGKKPEWLKIKVVSSFQKTYLEGLLKRLSLHTVCEEANCPNLMECFDKKTAAFMILGNVCTRNCAFCAVSKGIPSKPDENEPENIALAAFEIGLSHVVITSVTRDDLFDGGASHFAETIKALRNKCGKIAIEVLIPDFSGSMESLEIVAGAGPDIINHNVETVPRLYPEVRPMASYERSLSLLKNVKNLGGGKRLTKSGIMAGLGEKPEEVIAVMEDLRRAGCEMLTIGQYLAPSKHHHEVKEYVNPAVFDMYRQEGIKLGFLSVAAGPFIRSSYNAGEFYNKAGFLS
ncbi:MAG: lipoyl synthase [Brevinematales bacterium]|jgi:lipoic acid synthetase